MRKLTGLRLARGAEDTQRVLGDLGPDAEDVSRADFCARVRSSRRQVKAALLDQTVVAGLGNLLVDEILWRAKIHPRTLTADLTAAGARCGARGANRSRRSEMGRRPSWARECRRRLEPS